MAEALKALAEPETPGRDILVLSDDQFDAMAQCLSNLQFEVGAQCILLADVAGQLVAHIGETGGLDLPALVSLIGGGFATSFAMARYLGEGQALTLRGWRPVAFRPSPEASVNRTQRTSVRFALS